MATGMRSDNRLKATRAGNKLVNEFWDGLFRAKDEGKLVCAYNGAAVNPFLQAMDIAYMHGEAAAALLAARHLEKPPQAAAEARGYQRELCSYARTHIGCALFTERGLPEGVAADSLAARLPKPDLIVNAYAMCNTGMQWDEFAWRLSGKKTPRFNLHLPYLTYARGGTFLTGPDLAQAVTYLARQLREFTHFLEDVTGRPFNWDRFREIMSYIKKAAQVRLEGKALCVARPAPASIFDWAVSIAPINFMHGSPEIVQYFEGVKAEIEERIARGEGCVPDERYRLWWDGFQNWNKLGWLAEKFAAFGACVVAGRYTHFSFWTKPDEIDLDDPLEGIALNYIACPMNHSTPVLIDEIIRVCKDFSIDGIVLHNSRTCRAFNNPQFMLAEQAARRLGIPSAAFEGDIVDESFYQDELWNSRLEAMLEAIQARRAAA